MTSSSAVSHQDVLANLLDDAEVRREWEESTVARAIANQVIRYRVEHRLSQRELAVKLGVSASLVARLELGEHEARL